MQDIVYRIEIGPLVLEILKNSTKLELINFLSCIKKIIRIKNINRSTPDNLLYQCVLDGDAKNEHYSPS